jgi:hypothetical protein
VGNALTGSTPTGIVAYDSSLAYVVALYAKTATPTKVSPAIFNM